MNTNLVHIKSLVDLVMIEIDEKALEHLHRIFVALRRIRSSSIVYFDDFQAYLTKLEKNDPDCTFFSSYIEALRNYLDKKDPLAKLLDYLDGKGFTIDVLSTMQLSLDEKAFINRLPKNRFILQSLLFFFYQPRFSIKFFLNDSIYLSNEEKLLISNYQKLPEDLQNRVSSYAKELVKANHLEALNKSS